MYDMCHIANFGSADVSGVGDCRTEDYKKEDGVG